MRENAKYTTDEQKQSKYAGGGFAFARLILKSFLGLVSAPQEGAEGMRGGNSFGFLAGARNSETEKIQFQNCLGYLSRYIVVRV